MHVLTSTHSFHSQLNVEMGNKKVEPWKLWKCGIQKFICASKTHWSQTSGFREETQLTKRQTDM